MLKYCEDCNQEKPNDLSAPARTKARGFYDWCCWDCHIVSARRRRVTQAEAQAQDPEFTALNAELLKRQAQVLDVKTRIQALQQSQANAKAQAQAQIKLFYEAQNTKQPALGCITTKNGERLRIMSPAYKVVIQETLVTVATAEKLPVGPARDRLLSNLQDTLRVAQNKQNQFGPDAYDYMLDEEPENTHE